MSAEAQLRYLVLCWHMHQTLVPGTTSKTEYLLPWTYLHAIKDYVVMAAPLGSRRQEDAVVNLTPHPVETDPCAVQ